MQQLYPFTTKTNIYPYEGSVILNLLRDLLAEQSSSDECQHCNDQFPAGDTAKILSLASSHRILPLLHYAALGSGNITFLQADLLQALQNEAEHNHRRCLRLIFEMSKVLERLNCEGVHAIPYKGFTLSLLAYGHAHWREFDDLDILVKREQYFEPRKILTEFEAPPFSNLNPEKELHFHEYFGEYTLFKANGEVCLDIHHSLLGGGDLIFPISFSDVWHRLEPMKIAGRNTLSMCREDLLLYLCMNGLKDEWTILRSVCDLAGLIYRHPDLDWQLITQEAIRLRIDRPLYLGLLITHQLLEAPIPDEVLYKAKRDRGAQWLARLVCRRMLADLDSQRFFFPCYSFILKWVALKYWSAQLYYLRGVPARFIRLFFIVNYRDTEFIQLPRQLYFLYYFIRPIRVLSDYRANVFKLIFK